MAGLFLHWDRPCLLDKGHIPPGFDPLFPPGRCLEDRVWVLNFPLDRNDRLDRYHRRGVNTMGLPRPVQWLFGPPRCSNTRRSSFHWELYCLYQRSSTRQYRIDIGRSH